MIRIGVMNRDTLKFEVLKVSGVVFNSTGELAVFPVDDKGEETGEVKYIRPKDFITANIISI